MKDQTRFIPHSDPNPNDTLPQNHAMSAPTDIILNERIEEQSPPVPPPSVRAVQNVGCLLALFIVVQGIVDYSILRFLIELAQTVDGSLVGVAVVANGTAA